MQQKIIVALITFLVTSFGIVSNSLVFIATRKMSSMNSSFGVITKNQVTCNFIVSSVYLFYISPLQISNIKLMLDYSHFIGVFDITVYENSNLSHFLIASNRFCAVFLPFYYDNVFTIFSTKVYRNVIWVTATVWCIVFYEVVECHLAYNVEAWSLVFLDTEVGAKVTWYTDFTLNTFFVVLTFTTNLLTAFKAGRNSRMMTNAAGLQTSKLQKQRELNFLKQTFFTGLSVLFGHVAYYLIAPFVSNSVLMFCFGSLYVFMHCVEGAIILASNPEMRSVLKPRKTSPSTSANVILIIRK
ncbi:hypothetical protein B9Z55_019957 [Caenorhabditis nigoni]|uniref:7TM GPCR serpentine receptor class x (Srx) domain-containing protein n=1 Tax=Caenorhabditis nigoni TaxID=1611254 RepID=A0A2G5TKK9_9PELO|nr:hypothetical protein B9Z55_019957 [Caenorhabditis nigoni]